MCTECVQFSRENHFARVLWITTCRLTPSTMPIFVLNEPSIFVFTFKAIVYIRKTAKRTIRCDFQSTIIGTESNIWRMRKFVSKVREKKKTSFTYTEAHCCQKNIFYVCGLCRSTSAIISIDAYTYGHAERLLSEKPVDTFRELQNLYQNRYFFYSSLAHCTGMCMWV